MRLNLENDYAFRLIYALCMEDKGEVMTSAQLSQQLMIPERFTYRILRKLLNAGLIDSIRGPKGGYILSKEPSEISLYDVYVAISGDLVINACVAEGVCEVGCSFGICAVHNSLCDIQGVLEKEFKNVVFSDLIEKE